MPVVFAAALLPVGDDRAGYANVFEGIHVEAVVADATVEGFHESVAPGLP